MVHQLKKGGGNATVCVCVGDRRHQANMVQTRKDKVNSETWFKSVTVTRSAVGPPQSEASSMQA